MVDLHHPYSDQMITSVFCKALVPAAFNSSGLCSFNNSSVLFAFDEGQFRSFFGVLVLNISLFANGLRSGPSVTVTNITIQVDYQNYPPSIAPLNVTGVFFVQLTPGQRVVSLPVIGADVGEGEAGFQTIAECFFESVDNVAFFDSSPVFNISGNYANLTFNLKSFEITPQDFAVVFRSVSCKDNGGQGLNEHSNIIQVLQIQFSFPPELPSFLNTSSNLFFTELSFSGAYEDVLVLNGNKSWNEGGLFELSQESPRNGFLFLKFWISKVHNSDIGFELSEIRFSQKGLPVDVTAFCNVSSVASSNPIHAFDSINLTVWSVDAAVSPELSAINISCTRPLVLDSFAWSFGNDVERYPVEWKLIGCVSEDLRNCCFIAQHVTIRHECRQRCSFFIFS
jgi:hypothetical protein